MKGKVALTFPAFLFSRPPPLRTVQIYASLLPELASTPDSQIVSTYAAVTAYQAADMYTDRCCRVQPSDWLCRCSYSPGDIPGLPDSSFVKQCDSHFAEELVGDRDNLLPLQCHNMETDQSTVPWVCPRHHEEFFGPTGNLGAFADDVRYNCDDALKLLHSVVSPDNASLPHFRLINDAI